MTQKILVVAAEQLIRDTLKTMLEAEGLGVVPATDALAAQKELSGSTFDLLISDLEIGEAKRGGIDLLLHVNRTQQIPVILMTGLGGDENVAKDALKFGAKSILAKPFGKDDLMKAVRSASEVEDKGIGKLDPDRDFCHVSLEEFVTGSKMPYDIYIRLGKEKFVKVAHKGEEVDVERIRAYRARGIAFLHVTKTDFHGYLRQNLNILQKLKTITVVEPKKKLAFLKHTSDVVMEQLFKNDSGSAAMADAKLIVENTVNLLCEDQDTFDLLNLLALPKGDWVYAHSLGVSMFSGMIAKEVGWGAPATVYRLSLAGLLHDIGLKEIDRAIVDKPKNQMTKDALKAFEAHTTIGQDILSKVQTVPSDIMQIALQHHERDNGGGYPTGITKNYIQPLARLLAVADEFCNFAIQNPNSPGMPFDAAYERLVLTYGQGLDKTFLAALKTIVDRLSKVRNQQGGAA